MKAKKFEEMRIPLSEIQKGKRYNGTEAQVYVHGPISYRVSDAEESYLRQTIPWIGKEFENVVNIYDVWISEDNLIVKMETLYPLEWKLTEEEKEDQERLFTETEDEILKLVNLLPYLKTERMKEIAKVTISGANELGINFFDLGIHNVMKTKEGKLKLVDLW